MTKPTDKSRQRPATAPLKAPTAPKLSLPKAPPTPAVSTAVKKPLWMPTAGPGQMPRGQTIGGVVIPRKSAPPPAKPGFFGKLWGGVKNVGRGAWDATVDSAKGIYQVVRHPVETAKALGHLATHPGQIVDVAKTMWHDATKHGVAYAVGYVGANLAPMLLTGGGSAVGVTGRVLSVAGKARTLQVLARIPTVARVAKGSQYLMRVARGRAVQGAGRGSTRDGESQRDRVLIRRGLRRDRLSQGHHRHGRSHRPAVDRFVAGDAAHVAGEDAEAMRAVG